MKTQDYQDVKINEIYEKLIELTQTDKEQTNKNIMSFLNNIYEYKNYLRYKFIIDDIKEIYSKKEENKKNFEETRKQIEASEKKLRKTNKVSFFKKKEGKNLEQEKIIEELQELYKKLDKEQFNKKIYENLKDNSSLYEVFTYVKSDYNYMANCFIKDNAQIEPQEIGENIQELKNFIKSPYNTIMKNIHISDEKDIGIIIKDRYRLLGFRVEKEDLEEENISNLEKELKTLELSANLEKAGLKIDEIERACKIKELLKL